MIKIENVHVYGIQNAIYALRAPLQSWELSDSNDATIGEKDYKLMKQLISAGTDHSKFLRYIAFDCIITAPIYWWKEMDTYKVGTVRTSTSTMHTITKKPFLPNDFSWEGLNNNEINTLLRLLNERRNKYLDSKDKDEWKALIQILPESYNQISVWSANYTVLRNIYKSRKYHKLTEWEGFCNMIERLPYSSLITS